MAEKTKSILRKRRDTLSDVMAEVDKIQGTASKKELSKGSSTEIPLPSAVQNLNENWKAKKKYGD
uniref:Uncharacterized protein n=1 Tax=viral metagenome TaxID=1070528 RepID=A0A6M3LGM2_9ZZZZ